MYVNSDIIINVITEDVKNKKFQTYLEAFVDFCDKNKLDLQDRDEIKQYVNETLYCMLERDALKANLLHRTSKTEKNIEDFF